MTTKNYVAQTPSPPPVEPAPPTSRSVTFREVEGIWHVDVEVVDASRPFTERDFNNLARLLTIKRGEIRRAAYLKYRALMAGKATL